MSSDRGTTGWQFRDPGTGGNLNVSSDGGTTGRQFREPGVQSTFCHSLTWGRLSLLELIPSQGGLAR